MSWTAKEIATQNRYDILEDFIEYVASGQTDSSVLHHDTVAFFLEVLFYKYFPKARISTGECMVLHEKDIGCLAIDVEIELEDFNPAIGMEIFGVELFEKSWIRDAKGQRDHWIIRNYKGQQQEEKNNLYWLLDKLIEKYRVEI